MPRGVTSFAWNTGAYQRFQTLFEIDTTASFSSAGVALGWSYIQCHISRSTVAAPAISYVPQKSLSVFRAADSAVGFDSPGSSRSRFWKTKARASVNAVFGTPEFV